MRTSADIAQTSRLRSRHLLGIADLEAEEIRLILDTAEAMKEIGMRPIKKVPTLRGRTVINLFYESSTRTSSSFEIAAKRLSADTVNVKSAGSSVDAADSPRFSRRSFSALTSCNSRDSTRGSRSAASFARCWRRARASSSSIFGWTPRPRRSSPCDTPRRPRPVRNRRRRRGQHASRSTTPVSPRSTSAPPQRSTMGTRATRTRQRRPIERRSNTIRTSWPR